MATDICTFPEGWDKAKAMLKDVPESERDGALFGLMMTLMNN